MKRLPLVFSMALFFSIFSSAQIPSGYYNQASDLSCADLKTALKNIISSNDKECYSPCIWNEIDEFDVKKRQTGPGTSDSVIYDIYSALPGKTDPYEFTPGNGPGGQQDHGTGGTAEGQFYNREHSVPQSWFNGNTSVEGPATDYLIIFPVDKYINIQRNNLPYGEVADTDRLFENGSKIGLSSISGLTGKVFEPIDSFKGDVARSFFYFITRYEDSISKWTSNIPQVFGTSAYPAVALPYLQLMLKWNDLDPVSKKEIDRNNAAYSFQENRNPYVDSPQFVHRAWSANCPGLAALPVNLVSFTATLQNDNVFIQWQNANETDVSYYELQRSIDGIIFNAINNISSNGQSYSYSDTKSDDKKIYYRLKIISKNGTYVYSRILIINSNSNELSVYPNPATNFINLKLNSDNLGNTTVFINDLTGKILFRQDYIITTGSTLKIPLTNISAGIYAIHLITKTREYNAKVILTK